MSRGDAYFCFSNENTTRSTIDCLVDNYSETFCVSKSKFKRENFKFFDFARYG
jgi:hypothetical protein